MKRSWLLTAVVVALCGGCARSIQFTLPDTPLDLSLAVNGAAVKRCTIRQDSRQHKALSTWLGEHKNGWQGSVATYVPNVVVAGKDFNLNFLPSIAVLNYDDHQFTHQVSPSDFAFLVCVGHS